MCLLRCLGLIWCSSNSSMAYHFTYMLSEYLPYIYFYQGKTLIKIIIIINAARAKNLHHKEDKADMKIKRKKMCNWTTCGRIFFLSIRLVFSQNSMRLIASLAFRITNKTSYWKKSCRCNNIWDFFHSFCSTHISELLIQIEFR